MAKPVWFAGVCDSLLARVQTWYENYEKGEIYASRLFLDTTFQKQDLPVLYAHDVPWRQDELEHLVRILKDVKPQWLVTSDFARIPALVSNKAGRKKHAEMVKFRNGYFVLTLIFEYADLKELFLVLKEVKDGRRDTIEELLADKKKAGKEIWEM